MSDKLANRQRELMIKKQGRPILSLEFDVFDGDKVSMWAHTRHDVEFHIMKKAFEAIHNHILSFINDADMCPFNPDFLNDVGDGYEDNDKIT